MTMNRLTLRLLPSRLMSDVPYPPLAQHTSGVVARLHGCGTQIAAWFWVEASAASCGWRSA